MKEPNKESNLTETDLWREKQEMKRVRRNILGMEDYGWDGDALRRDELK